MESYVDWNWINGFTIFLFSIVLCCEYVYGDERNEILVSFWFFQIVHLPCWVSGDEKGTESAA